VAALIAKALTDADYSSKVGIAAGIQSTVNERIALKATVELRVDCPERR
jgi:hypothetical protein